MDDIVVSAPGKVILHGEHAVVYGKIAVAASLNLRTYMRLKKTGENKVRIALPDINIEASWETEFLQSMVTLPLCDPLKPEAASEKLLSQLKSLAGICEDEADTKQLATIAFLYLYCAIGANGSTLPAIDVKVVSQLPVSAGLGSSAAYAVCLTSSLLQLTGHIPPPLKEGGDRVWSHEHQELINSWAYFWEKIIHGNPSGVDNSISTFGGAIRFQAGKITSLSRVPKLKILLVNTKVPRSTKVLVAGVRNRFNKHTNIIQPVLDSIDAIAQGCETLLAEIAESESIEHYQTLEDLIDMNQCQLGTLGVSHPVLEVIVKTAAKHSLHAKLTGAGGGGCAFVLLRPDTSSDAVAKLKSEFESQNLICWETSVGSQGVTCHDSNTETNGGIQALYS